VKPNIIKALQFLFFLLLAGVLLYFAFRGIDLEYVATQIRQADYRWVTFSLIFALLALVIRAYRWRLLIEPLNKQPKVKNIFHAINVGYLANFLFPRIGEITRCAALNRTDNIPVDKLFGTVVVERVFDLLMSIMLLFLVLLLKFDIVATFLVEQILQPLIVKIKNIEIVWIIVATAIIALATFALYTILKKTLIFRKIKDLFNGVGNGIKSVKHLRNFKLFIALTVLIFVMYLLQTYVLFFALESTSSLGIGDALFILVLSTIAFIAPVQGGIGAYHWIVSMGLVVFGVAREEGMVYATISHSVTSILLIILGTVSLIVVFYRKNHEKI